MIILIGAKLSQKSGFPSELKEVLVLGSTPRERSESYLLYKNDGS